MHLRRLAATVLLPFRDHLTVLRPSLRRLPAGRAFRGRAGAALLAGLLALLAGFAGPLRAQSFVDYNAQNGWTQSSAIIENAGSVELAVESGTGYETGYIVTTFISNARIQKYGAGTLVLTGWLQPRSGVNVSGGTLQVGDGGTVGWIGGSFQDIVIDAYATLAFNRSDAITYGAYIENRSGGTLVQMGSGTLTLTGDNTEYIGGTTLTAGILAAASASALGKEGTILFNGGALGWANGNTVDYSSRFSIAAGQSYRFDTGGSDVTLATALAGNGTSGLVKSGAGTLTLTGANTYTGGTTVSAGTLAVGSDTALGSGTVTLAGGTLAASGGARTIANPITVTANSTLGGSQDLTLTGAVTLSGSTLFTVANTALTTIRGAIGESGPSIFIKQGAGTLVLTGANTYTGGTLIAAGTVRINNTTGSAFGTGAVTIASGATLTGAGSFSGALQNNGTYAPGNSPDLQTLSSFNQGATGTLVLEIAGLDRGTGYDALDITGGAVFGGTLNVVFYGAFTAANLSAGDTFNLFDWGSATGTFASLNLADISAYGLTWDTSALYTTGVLSVASSASAVPEPATYAALLGLAALGFVCYRRRRT